VNRLRLTPAADEVELTIPLWRMLLEYARMFGWQAAGTRVDGACLY
jgi:hypothetical protein